MFSVALKYTKNKFKKNRKEEDKFLYEIIGATI
jgi:hypothetical protein